MSYFKNNSDWKELTAVYTRVGGQWKKVTESFAKINGVWKQTTFASAPEEAPQLTWHAYGQFRLVNYDPSLYYEARFVSGSGSASRSGNIYTLSGVTSAFEVVSKYFPQGSPSPPGYMERQRPTTTFIPQCRYISRTCTRQESYAASSRDETRTHTGDTSSCAMYSCNPGFSVVGPDGSNRCWCSIGGLLLSVVGGGQCPGAPWYNCGNRCCYNYTERVYFCPSGGSLSGTSCIVNVPFDCSYWESCTVENPVPPGYTKSGGEWWRTSR